MKMTLAAAAMVACTAGSTLAADIHLRLIKQISMADAVAVSNPNRIGTNIATVAWDGTKLYVGGNNNSGATLASGVGIVEVLDPLGTPTLGGYFGRFNNAPNTRGYTGMNIRNGVLAAAYDSGGATVGAQMAFNTSDNSTRFLRSNIRGFTGPAFDPGFGLTGSTAGQIGYSNTGSGRRAVLDSATGADIFTTANGGIWNSGVVVPVPGDPVPGTNNRDITFDAAGNIYGRSANAVIRGIRTGNNSFAAAPVAIFYDFGAGSQSLAANVGYQQIEFAQINTNNIQALFFNDRPLNQAGTFASVVKAIRPDGTALSIDLGSFGVSTTTSIFDFSYDAASQTLAVADFSNSNVYIFSVVPTPGAAAVLGLGGLVAARRRRA